MKRNSVIATLIAAAFALPLAATAGGTDKSGTAKSASTTHGASAGSAAFTSADKNMDGYISTEEAKGSQHAANFATLDKNADGRLSREEHDAVQDQLAGYGSTTGNATTGSATTGSSPTTGSSMGGGSTNAGSATK